MRLSRSWMSLSLLAVAAIAAVLALVFRPSRSGPEEDVQDLDLVRGVPKEASPFSPMTSPQTGGFFDGTVVDDKDQPIPYASVILVSKGMKIVEVVTDSLPDPIPIPSFGNYGTAADVKTDEKGRFHVAAGDAWIDALIAYHPDHAPGILTGPEGTQIKPGKDLIIRLPAAGRLKAKVVDAVTKEPVAGADVAIFLQNKVGPMGYTPFSDHNAFAKYQQYLEKELSARIWTIQPNEEQSAGLHVRSRSDGTFEFGPTTDEVELQFVITHPEYAWTEMDPGIALAIDNPHLQQGQKPVERIDRMVISPGKTKERTFELKKGKEITGRVVDEHGVGLADVKVAVDHIVQQAQAVAYRIYQRHAVTDRDGRFRVAGLDRGPYQVRFTHESFGTWYPPEAVKEGSRDVEFKVMSVGWIEGRLSGGPDGKKRFLAKFILEPAAGGNSPRETRTAVKDGEFKIEQVQPGTWRLRVEYQAEAMSLVGVPQTIVVESGRRTDVDVSLSKGGTVRATLLDVNGRAVDPATLQLEVLEGDKKAGRMGGTLMSRQGVVIGECILPGRYRAHASALGFMEAVSEPFDVVEGSTTRVDVLVMHRQSFLAVEGIVDAKGHGVSGVTTEITLQAAGGERQRGFTDSRGRIPVSPGRLTIRAESSDGRVFEDSIEVGDGATVPVKIVLR